jgi:glucosylceramidase
MKISSSCLLNLLAIPLVVDADPTNVKWFQTAQHTADRLTEQPVLTFTTATRATKDVLSATTTYGVSIDRSKKHQSILGFGGALTQSSATVYKELPSHLQEEMIEAYYGKTGIGYTTGRLPIHSCDFSVDIYTFDDVAGDKTLHDFDTEVKYDQELSLPLIHDALKANPDLLFYGSPWSPPAWMKDNNDMLHGGKLLPEYRASWADYFSKWITAYEAQGVTVWGITVQNEPEAVQSWESCIYTPEETRDFVADYLGPVLDKTHPGVKILGFDHNKDHIQEWADVLLGANSSSAEYVDGIAFHWYSGSCFSNVEAVSALYPDAILLPSEACFELTVMEDDASDEAWLVNGTWNKGEGYGFDILGDLEAGSVGWTDWNILLDREGGPNHVGNFCDAAIIADTSEDSEEAAIYYHPQYYYMGHFSKFLAPNSTRLESSVTGGSDSGSGDCSWPYGECDGDTIYVTSWQQNDDSISVVVMNCGEGDKEIALTINDVEGELLNTVPANSIQTYLIPM